MFQPNRPFICRWVLSRVVQEKNPCPLCVRVEKNEDLSVGSLGADTRELSPDVTPEREGESFSNPPGLNARLEQEQKQRQHWQGASKD